MRRLEIAFFYGVLALIGVGWFGGVLCLYFMVRLYLNTSPMYMAWLFGFVS